MPQDFSNSAQFAEHGGKATVLGAGIAGLAVARGLAQRGVQVTVLEQADGLREVGAGIQISPNGAAVLRAMGLGEALEDVGLRAEAVELRDGLTGNLVTRLDIGKLRPDQHYYFLHRADLMKILSTGARDVGVEMRLLQRIDRVDLSGPRPAWRTMQRSEGDSTLLIGADGINSKLRHAMMGCNKPFFTGQVAWRAVVPEHPGAPRVAEVHMGPRRHIVSYPLRGGNWRNIIAVEERDNWVEESWTQPADLDQMRDAFSDFGPSVQDWLSRVEDAWLWGLFRHPVADNWYRTQPEGAAVMLGDAAHPTLPFLAQGANMALEDAWVLSEAVTSGLPIGMALQRYQAARRLRCVDIVEAANKNARMYHLSGPMRNLAHMGLRFGGMIAPQFALKRFDWLYDFDVTRESAFAPFKG